MEFILHYRGELKSNRGAAEKHELRRRFHPQLKELWGQPPLSDFTDLLVPKSGATPLGLIRELGAYRFAPLVASNVHLVAELEITLLRPEPPGAIVRSGGDIDNRIKTLLDALKVPDANAIPLGAMPEEGEDPFFCLLEDDALITKLSVHADRLLERPVSPSEVELMMLVRTKQLRMVIETVGLA